MTYREVEKRLKDNGWFPIRQKGAHVQFRQRGGGLTVTVPNHPGKDLSLTVLKNLSDATGLSFR